MYRLRLWARSSPPGASVSVLQTTTTTTTTTTNTGAEAGAKARIKTKGATEVPDFAGVVVGVEWVQVEASVLVGPNASATAPIVIGMRAPSPLGGTVFIDDVELVL